MKEKTGAPEYNKTQPQNDLENRSIFIPLGSISGSQISDIAPFLDDTAGGTDAETTKAPTSNVIYDHAAATTGVHGLGSMSSANSADYVAKALFSAKGMIIAGSAANSPAGLALAGTTNYILAADTAEVTGLKWMALAGGGDMTKAVYDPDLDSRIALAQLYSDVAGTADITSHASLTTGVHGVGTSLVASTALVTSAMTTHTALTTGIHGVGTSLIASTAQITAAMTTHSALTTGVHGVGTSLVASVKDIADHAGLTATHGVAGTIAAKSDIATDTNLSAAAQSTIIAKPTWIVASSSTVTGTALTDITGWTFVCATGSTYKFEAYISNNCSHTTGVAYGIGLAVTSCIVEAQIHGISVAGTGQAIMLAATGTKSAFFNKIAATGAVYFTGIVKTAGTGGTLSLQHCAGSAAATVTVRTNSVWEIIKIA